MEDKRLVQLNVFEQMGCVDTLLFLSYFKNETFIISQQATPTFQNVGMASDVLTTSDNQNVIDESE